MTIRHHYAKRSVGAFLAVTSALTMTFVSGAGVVHAQPVDEVRSRLVGACPDATLLSDDPLAGCGFRSRLSGYVDLGTLPQDDKSLVKAFEEIAASLDHIVGDEVVDRIAIQHDFAAINEIEKFAKKNDAAEADSAMRAIALADRVAARRVVNRLDKAIAAELLPVSAHANSIDVHFANGDGDLAAGNAKQALADYRSAWQIASNKMESLGALIDPDGDLIPSDIEEELGTSATEADTDGDQLADIVELWTTFTDPTLGDSDGDGVADGDADPDQDGLTHLEELELATDPLVADTDGDLLDDGFEVGTFGSDPLAPDSDGDRLMDEAEFRLGTDPRNPDTDGDGILDGDEIYTTSLTDADVGLQLAITGPGDVKSTVHVESRTDLPYLSDIVGGVGGIVDLTTPNEFSSAEITLDFDPTLVPGGDVAGLALVYFDEEYGTWIQLESPVVDVVNNTITATTTHFTLFTALHFPTFIEELRSFDPIDPDGTGGGSRELDVVLDLDSSGSMRSNDPAGIRRSASKDFIDALSDGDRVAVVDFDSRATLLQGLTTDFAAAKSAVDRVNSSGGTNIGAAISVSNNELINNSSDDRAKVTILLTDGQGSYNTSLTAQAVANNIRICTIGLGSSPDVGLLTQIADATGCQYFSAANASDLPDIFDRLPDNIDPAGDLDFDGLANGMEIDGIVLGTGRRIFTDPRNADTDGDGLLDGEEIQLASEFDATVGYTSYYYMTTDASDADSDGDGLLDSEEQPYGIGTAALDADTDNDGLRDGVEIDAGFDPLAANADGDSYGDALEFANETDPYSYDLTGIDQGRAFIAGGLLGEFGSEIPAFDTSLKDLAGDLAGLVPTIIGDVLSGALDFAIGGLVGIGCFAGGVVGFFNPWGGSPTDAVCDLLNMRIVYNPAFATSISYLAGWIAVSLIPFVDIAASVRDLIGAIVKGDVVGAVLELIFGVIGFVAPAIGDLPGIIGKIGKFLTRADQAIQGVFAYVVKRFGDAGSSIVRPLLKEFSGLSDEAIESVGGTAVIIEMASRNTNLKKLANFIANNGAVRRFLPNQSNIANRVDTRWRTVSGDDIRKVAAQAVGTEATIEVLEARGYRVLFADSNVPLQVSDDSVKSIVNGPDIVAVSPTGQTVIFEVKASAAANGTSVSYSTIRSTAGGNPATQTSRVWLEENPQRYLRNLERAAEHTMDPALREAVTRLNAILDGGTYDSVIAGVSSRTRFSGTLEDAFVNSAGGNVLNNGGNIDVWEIDVPTSAFDDAVRALTPDP